MYFDKKKLIYFKNQLNLSKNIKKDPHKFYGIGSRAKLVETRRLCANNNFVCFSSKLDSARESQVLTLVKPQVQPQVQPLVQPQVQPLVQPLVLPLVQPTSTTV